MAVTPLKTENKIHATNPMIAHWRFREDCKDEAKLADAMAEVAYNNGMTVLDMEHLFPAVLRMLKSKSRYSK